MAVAKWQACRYETDTSGVVLEVVEVQARWPLIGTLINAINSLLGVDDWYPIRGRLLVPERGINSLLGVDDWYPIRGRLLVPERGI